jgi:hypothetical protein
MPAMLFDKGKWALGMDFSFPFDGENYGKELENNSDWFNSRFW